MWLPPVPRKIVKNGAAARQDVSWSDLEKGRSSTTRFEGSLAAPTLNAEWIERIRVKLDKWKRERPRR